jgi:hypothetical protein
MAAPGAHRGLRRTPFARPPRLVLGTTTSALGLACWGRGLRGPVWSNSVYHWQWHFVFDFFFLIVFSNSPCYETPKKVIKKVDEKEENKIKTKQSVEYL